LAFKKLPDLKEGKINKNQENFLWKPLFLLEPTTLIY